MLAVGSFLFHAKAELYSYKEHKWRSVAPYPYATSLHSAATVYFQSTFVVIGGYENGGAGELDIVARLDPVTFEWDQLGRINYKRSGHSAIVSGETFYVVGGAGGKPIEKCDFEQCTTLEIMTDFKFYPELFLVSDDFCQVQ